MVRDQRRLAAIVSADVAGYSRLMGRDESSTLIALKAHRRELIDPKIAEYGGRIVKTARRSRKRRSGQPYRVRRFGSGRVVQEKGMLLALFEKTTPAGGVFMFETRVAGPPAALYKG
jgi:hypothetical protein